MRGMQMLEVEMDLLNEISPQVIVSLVSVVITGCMALIGTLVSGHAEKNKLNLLENIEQNKDKRNLLSKKIEETFSLFANFSENFHSYYFAEIAHIRGHMTRVEANDLVKSSKFGEKGDFQKLEMNISLYFPEFIEGLENVFNIRDVVSKASSAANEKKCSETLNNLIVKLEEFESCANTFKVNISKIARKL